MRNKIALSLFISYCILFNECLIKEFFYLQLQLDKVIRQLAFPLKVK